MLPSFMRPRARRHPKGASLAEYGILTGLISVVAIGAVYQLGKSTDGVFCDVIKALDGNIAGVSQPGRCSGTPMVLRYVGDSADISLSASGPVFIDWGDGQEQRVDGGGSYTHAYAQNGEYRVEIRGRSIDWMGAPASPTLVAVESFGDAGLRTLNGSFQDADVLRAVAPIPASVVELMDTFSGVDLDVQGLDRWDVSRVVSFAGMFRDAETFNGDITRWDVAAATDMDGMFENARAFSRNLTPWCVETFTQEPARFRDGSLMTSPPWWGFCGGPDFGNAIHLVYNGGASVSLSAQGRGVIDWGNGLVEPFNSPFGLATFSRALPAGPQEVRVAGRVTHFQSPSPHLTRVVSFGNTGLLSLQSAFANADNLDRVPDALPATVTNLASTFSSSDGDLVGVENWGVGQVTTFFSTFRDATQFNRPIGGWIVSGATDMAAMFQGATSFNQDLNSWRPSSVTTMSGMFRNATQFNGNISDWTVGSVTTFSQMFQAAPAFRGAIGGWDMRGAMNLNSMFYQATNFNTDLKRWCVSRVNPSPPSLFSTGSGLSSTNAPIWGSCPS